MKNYTLKTSGNSKIAAVYAKVCLPGNLGASFIENGFSQSALTAFTARVALAAAAKGMDAEALTALLESLAACNTSQARQAIESLVIVWLDEAGKPEVVRDKDGKPVLSKPDDPTSTQPLREISVADYWAKQPGGAPRATAIDLSIFGLSAEPAH